MTANITIQNEIQLLLVLFNSYLANFNLSLDNSTFTPTTSSFKTGALAIKASKCDSDGDDDDDVDEYDIVVKNKSTKVSLVQTTSLDLEFPFDLKTDDLDNLESNPKFAKLFSQLHHTFDEFIKKSTTVDSAKETENTQSSTLQEGSSTGQGTNMNYPRQRMPKIPLPRAELPISSPPSSSSRAMPIPDDMKPPEICTLAE
ncbi:unnamed protein product [Ambrosiozyma monospora]|uniref:Unnamed protein product n=1 Tax=Ambrosiozyma monospora TaxID=43982 RepID=A0ACB5U5R1_AMBMO|nr:unnamed protein product [Ambrosiozyma monospora]